MKKFFYLHFKEDDGGGVAYSSDDKNSEDNAEGCVKFSVNGAIQDYQANDLGLPLMSSKLKNVIDSAVCEEHQWESSFIQVDDSEKLEYFIPRFSDEIDFIFRERSKIINGPIGEIIMKACLQESKIGELEFFPLTNSSMRLVVSNRLKEDIEERNLTGIEFSTVPVA